MLYARSRSSTIYLCNCQRTIKGQEKQGCYTLLVSQRMRNFLFQFMRTSYATRHFTPKNPYVKGVKKNTGRRVICVCP